MIKTQIYLTKEERGELSALSNRIGKKQSELIREAVDNLIVRYNENRHLEVLDRVAGIWKKRDDLPDFEEIRKNWDRSSI